jgi:signal peptidase II
MKNYITIFFLVLIDQITKYSVTQNLSLNETHYITNYLNLIYIENRGLILGAFSGVNPNIMLLVHILLFIIALFVIKKFLYSYSELKNVAILFYSGAIGNTIDRIFKEGVIDFIDFHYMGIHWPAFNLADFLISLGVIILIYKLFKGHGSISLY